MSVKEISRERKMDQAGVFKRLMVDMRWEAVWILS